MRSKKHQNLKHSSFLKLPKDFSFSASVIIFAFLALALTGALSFWLLCGQNLNLQTENEALKTKLLIFNNKTISLPVDSVQDVLEKVSRLADLPQNEPPSVATVTDPKKLQDQPFFEKARAGDKVIFYSSSKKAYLYRPSENKIIEFGNLDFGKMKLERLGGAPQQTQ